MEEAEAEAEAEAAAAAAGGGERKMAGGGGEGGEIVVVLHLSVKDHSFNLLKAVCSHGLFMMAPNRWDPATASLRRPLRLSSSSLSLPVRVSQPSPPPAPLIVSVYGTASLPAHDQRAILMQVRRMLRISAKNDRMIRQFHQIHPEAKERGFGRIFRSPTLFEDMVKCILLCNCQWSRTLSMAKALCELQKELEHSTKSSDLYPKTTQPGSLKRKLPNTNDITKSKKKFQASPTTRRNVDPDPVHQLSVGTNVDGNFPSPEELAIVGVKYLSTRCKLGYRARHISSLAQDIVRCKIPFGKFEQIWDGSCTPYRYGDLDKELASIDGFGPFTRANVLMCMGFYNRIPADSETLRHLEQLHARKNCKVHAMKKDLEAIYGKYAPFQFLGYWSELWACYEETFGKASEMSPSDYQLITGNNMKNKISEDKSLSSKEASEEYEAED